jgi:hypothetical protein
MNYNINQIIQDARQKLDAEYQQRQSEINAEYQDKMNQIMGDFRNYGNSFQNRQQGIPQQITPVNSEIQNAFMRSPEYQQNFQGAFNQFLMQNFFYQFQNSPFYVELKKYADNAYPEFERNYIAAAQKVAQSKEKPQKNTKENGSDKKEDN